MAIRYGCAFTIKLTKSLNIHRTVLSSFNDRTSSYLTMAISRMFSQCLITPNLKLNSITPVALEAKRDSLPVVKSNEDRPLVVLLEYMNAKGRHIRKFIDFYMENGFDVLQVHLKPWQLLWPTKGSQLVAKDVAQFLVANALFSPMVIHGFSVGGYLWGEVLLHFSRDPALYQSVTDRIKCRIFDSAVDVDDIPEGFPRAVFPKNQMLKSAFEKYLRYHLKTFYTESTQHYIAARKKFSSGLERCPTLMITSNADPMSSVAVNENVKRELSAVNLECYLKVFEGSTHVAHFKVHKNEYIAEIESILTRVNLVVQRQLQAKL